MKRYTAEDVLEHPRRWDLDPATRPETIDDSC